MLIPQLRRAALACAVATALAGCHAARVSPSAASTADSTTVRRDIAYLASDALEGRATGTPGNDSAAAYIARRYASLKLATVITPACEPRADGRGVSARCRGSYFQPFEAQSIAAAHAGLS